MSKSLFKNKKAMAFLIIGLGFFLTALMIMSAEYNSIDRHDFVGRHQYQLLQTNELSKEIQTYINLASKYSSQYSIISLFENSGFYQERTEDGEKIPLLCGSYQYPLYFTNNSCVPDFEESIKSYFNEAFNDFLSEYNKSDIYFNYDLSLNQESQKKLRILSEANTPLKLYLNTKKSTNNIFIDTPFGTFGAEKIINCTTGKCVAEIAEKYTEIYRQDKTAVNYVLGGESPYPVADTTRLAKQQGSFFYGINPEADEPGFDCSGWVWWVEKHAGIKQFDKRLTANDYYEIAKKDATKICDQDSNPCLRKEILEKAKPGDILFHGTKDKIGHIMIYIGDGKISHSRGSKGLVTEELPYSYASDSETNIMGVYRFPYNEEGVDHVDSIIMNKNSNSSNSSIKDNTSSKIDSDKLIGPSFWCSEEDSLPSKTYQNQISKTAWNSKDLTYFDIAVNTGFKKGIDPAFIITHMVLESSMGRNDRCISSGKSHLTGCGWYGSCSKDCACDSGYVSSDYAQASCTASTDKNAFLESETGNIYGGGHYTKCNQYKSNPEKRWTCILCTYQGNYDKDVTRKNRPYFTKDGTCDYAQQFKKTYCSWRNYFKQKGYDISNEYTFEDGEVSNSYIEFKPYIDTNMKLNLNELAEIKDFINQTETNCKDNLRVCIKKQIEEFNKNHKIKILFNFEEDSLARDIIDQMNDCYNNEQTNCVCPIKINTKLNSRNFNKYFIRFKDDKNVFSSDFSATRQSYDTHTIKELTNLNFVPSVINDSNGPVKKEYVDLVINKKSLDESRLEIEKTGFDEKWDLNLMNSEDLVDVALKKSTFRTMYWDKYEDKNVENECRDNKRYFRLQAGFTFTNKTMDFSIKLKDTTPPKITLKTMQQTDCQGKPAIELSWDINADTDPAYDFIIDFQGQNNQFRAFEKTAEDLSSSKRSFQLYKTEFNNKITYHYLVDRTPDKDSLVINQTYILQVYVRDHYKNIQESTPQSIKIISDEDSSSTTSSASSTLNTINNLANLFFDSSTSCSSQNYEIVNLKRNKVTSLSKETTEEIQNQTNYTGFVPNLNMPINFQLIPYDGLYDPLSGEQLYWIKNIPNVVCDESTSTVAKGTNIKGKYCATTKEMLYVLNQLSKDVLVPKNYKLIVTQAFRTKELQQLLWDKKGHNPKLACNPNKKICPHQKAGALDINIFDQNQYARAGGRKLNISELEPIMCEAGFVRYSGETWHFEYGTPQWELAMTKRERGDPACTY